MMTTIGINGFGRIGRNILRAARGNKNFDVKAINDIADAKTLAHLLKYDSNYGPFPGQVHAEKDAIIVDDKKIRITQERDPANLPWKELGVDVAMECTGLFNTREGGEKHLSAGARKVLFSAPSKGEDITIVLGVNFDAYDKKSHKLISNASCTTNCLAPVVKVLHETFGIKHGLMNTIHAYTNDQNTLDQPHKDLRRARAAALSMIPTSTGAAKAIGLVMPALKGKLDGLAIRVPTPTVSVVDLTAILEQSASVEEINATLAAAAAKGPLKGILGYSEEPLVSMDYKGDPRSSVIDALSTAVVGGNMVKVLSWYDNEWGFSNRMVEVSQRLI
ncbi:MAG: type I glyceraldehyde-3-phosphate dehydrogenase [Candidatus Lambdaproteobacteria bacterium]|nr:type I glyceraldehyde-3-phosphate dehydrogenase [Candidatus Lambdaproteobacteria bacterium]